MNKIKIMALVSAIAGIMIFTGCTQNEENLALAGAGVAVVAVAANNYHKDGSSTSNYSHNGYNYGENRNYAYRDGVRAGCQSRNYWSQDNYRYQNDNNYRSGWKKGYNNCR